MRAPLPAAIHRSARSRRRRGTRADGGGHLAGTRRRSRGRRGRRVRIRWIFPRRLGPTLGQVRRCAVRVAVEHRAPAAACAATAPAPARRVASSPWGCAAARESPHAAVRGRGGEAGGGGRGEGRVYGGGLARIAHAACADPRLGRRTEEKPEPRASAPGGRGHRAQCPAADAHGRGSAGFERVRARRGDA